MPLFFTWQRLGLVNNLFGLILIYIATNAPFAIFLLRSYMLQLPRDFEDAARVDGASEWQVFAAIVVPLSWPGFLTVGLVVALSVWNEFLLATVFLTEQELFTVVTSYYNFATRFSRDWTMTSAAAIMMILPVDRHLPRAPAPVHRRTDAGRYQGLSPELNDGRTGR